MRKACCWVLVLMVLPVHGQVPCPVTLTSAVAGPEGIRLQFRNKGKVPIEQLSLACTPPADRKSRTGLCQNVTGIFYPGQEYDADIPYAGAKQHGTMLSVKAVRMAEGLSWNARSLSPCKSLRVRRTR